MVARHEAATRHLPVALARSASEAPRGTNDEREVRRASETRLQAAVVRSPQRDDLDPYADVPCTD